MYYNPSVIVNKLEQELRLNYDDIKRYLINVRIRLNQEKINNYLNIKNQEIKTMKHTFEPYTLEYFKKLMKVYRKKCNNLIKIIDGIIDNNIPDEVLKQLDIKISKNGNILMSDIMRLIIPLEYNFNKLREIVAKANSLDTYYNYNISLDLIHEEGRTEEELYPREEIQNEYYEFEGEQGYISYTEKQKKLLRKKQDEVVDALCDVYKHLK